MLRTVNGFSRGWGRSLWVGEAPALDLGSCCSELQVLRGPHNLSAASQHLATGLAVTHLMTPWPHTEQKPGVGILFLVSTVKTSDCPQTWAGIYLVPGVLPRGQKPRILCMENQVGKAELGFLHPECEPNHLPTPISSSLGSTPEAPESLSLTVLGRTSDPRK